MPMKMSDYSYGAKFRDLILAIVRKEIESQRPLRYATVNIIDRPNRICYVTFTGAENPVKVSMGAVQPKEVGQVVRVEGYMGDWFISDIMGGAHYLA